MLDHQRILRGFLLKRNACATAVAIAVICLIAVAVASTGCKNEMATNQSVRNIRAKRKMIDTQCGPIEYGEGGPKDGIPILISHGSMGGYDHGLHFAAGLAERDPANPW